MKKGFTLVELLAVIIILGILSLIAGTTVTTFLKKGKTDLYNQQLKNIELACKNWGSENSDLIEEKFDSYNSIIVTIGYLQDKGYIDDNIKNVKDNKKINQNDIFSIITKSSTSKKYDYELLDEGFEDMKTNTNSFVFEIQEEAWEM